MSALCEQLIKCASPPPCGAIRDTVYPKKYAQGFCFAVLCCGYTLTDFPISIRLTSLALGQLLEKRPWRIWINTCEFILDDCITTTKQSTTKPCAYFLVYTVGIDSVQHMLWMQPHANNYGEMLVYYCWEKLYDFLKIQICLPLYCRSIILHSHPSKRYFMLTQCYFNGCSD